MKLLTKENKALRQENKELKAILLDIKKYLEENGVTLDIDQSV